ncbi:MAG: reprolysin-like metallopeptidase, partial [bacterium]
MSRVPGLPTAITLAASWSITTCCLAATETTASKIAAPAIVTESSSEFGFSFDPAEFAELTQGAPAPASLNQLGAKGLVLQSRTEANGGAFYVFTSPEDASWHATLLLKDGRLTGVIDHPGEMRTTVNSIRAGVSSARVDNALKDLPCGCTDEHLSPDLNGPIFGGGLNNLGGDGGVAGGPCDNGSTVDVLVVYTNAAVAQAGSEAALLDSIDWAMADSNAIYAGSGIALQARLVGTSRLTTYVENADMGVDLNVLTNTTDGIIDNVHTLRDTLGADLVALVRATGGGACGVAWLMPANNPSSANLGFSVTALDCFSNRTFTHELGHNMGACHAPGDGGGCNSGGIFSYSLGHRFFGTDGLQYRTVMAYLPGTRIPRFSSPLVTWAGTATGIANQRDNARTLNETRLAFTNFRCSADGSGSCGGGGSCFLPHGGQGCSTVACCQLVCAADPFCCNTSWDELCVSQAFDLCT